MLKDIITLQIQTRETHPAWNDKRGGDSCFLCVQEKEAQNVAQSEKCSLTGTVETNVRKAGCPGNTSGGAML